MTNKKAIEYLYNKAVSDLRAAELSLDLLLNKAVGIGDHSTGDFTKNLDEALSNLDDANSRLETMSKYLGTALIPVERVGE